VGFAAIVQQRQRFESVGQSRVMQNAHASGWPDYLACGRRSANGGGVRRLGKPRRGSLSKHGGGAIMKRWLWVGLLATTLAATSGCCCVERFWIYGCDEGGCFGPPYGHEGPPHERYWCANGYCANCAEVGRRNYTVDQPTTEADSEAISPQAVPLTDPAGEPLPTPESDPASRAEDAAADEATDDTGEARTVSWLWSSLMGGKRDDHEP
jgi:hypothetical protein